MNDPGRMYMPQWTSSSTLKGCLKDHPAMKLMEMVAKRDAAFAERDMAMAEKKTACAQRDAALLQRDLAYADRNAVWMERDAMLAALAMIRMGKENREAAAMLMQMFNGIPALFMDANSQMVPEGAAAQFENYWKHSEVRSITAGAQVEDPLPQSKRKRKQRTLQDVMAELENSCKRNAIKKIFEAETPRCPSASPPPYCSCTGSNQQCYKWGKGGWQSACCTNFLSMYPLPMSTRRQSSRVPGRKMSGGAFAKLLERLATEGVDISVPIDLKRHWAKHGTNRYIIIK